MQQELLSNALRAREFARPTSLLTRNPVHLLRPDSALRWVVASAAMTGRTGWRATSAGDLVDEAPPPRLPRLERADHRHGCARGSGPSRAGWVTSRSIRRGRSTRQRRRCTHDVPSRRHSSHPSGVFGSTKRGRLLEMRARPSSAIGRREILLTQCLGPLVDAFEHGLLEVQRY